MPNLGVALLLHELQGRVTSIAIHAGEMRRKRHSGAQTWTLERLDKIARAAAEMQSILDAVRLIQHGLPPEMEPVNVSSLCSDILGKSIEEQPILKNTTFFVQDGIQVTCNAREIRIVLENLLANSLKFSARRSAPFIHVSSGSLNGRTVVQVTDNGIGVAQEDTERMFGPFTRLTGEYPGTGLGLTIAKLIVERHGGRIWAEGSPGGGATISFVI